EVAEVVGRHLQLETVRRSSALRRRHDGGVVDQYIEPRQSTIQAFGQLAYRSQVGQIDGFELDARVGYLLADALNGFPPALDIARGDDDLGARPGQRQRILVAHAAGAAGDQHDTALL